MHVAGRRADAMISRPISVMMVSNALIRGGAEEHILQLLQELDRQWFRLHLVCTPELEQLIRPDLPADVGVSVLTLDHLTDIVGAFRLVRAIRRHRVQILHSHMFRASLFASPIGQICGVPVIIETSHGREVWRKGWKASFFVDRFVSRRVDRLIAVSEATARYLVEHKGIPAEKVSVIRSAIKVQQFDPNHPAPKGTKRALGFAESDPLLVVVGRLEPQKGHAVMIDAMPGVLEEFPRARLVCVSDGSLRSQLEAQVRQKGLQESIRFVGYQPDVRDWLALADVNVLPSWYEGLPLAAIEALAAQRPMVATAVDGTPEVVINQETGLLVPPGNPERLSSAICQLLRDPQRARQMAIAGRKLVVERFSIEKLVNDTKHLYLTTWDNYLRINPSVTAPDAAPSHWPVV